MKRIIAIAVVIIITITTIGYVNAVCVSSLNNGEVMLTDGIVSVTYAKAKKKHKKAKTVRRKANASVGRCNCKTCLEGHVNCYEYGRSYRLHGIEQDFLKKSIKCDCEEWNEGFNAPTGYETLDGYVQGEELFYVDGGYDHNNVWLVYDEALAKRFITENGGIWKE